MVAPGWNTWLIRTTDPEGLVVDGIRINGETMHSGMRLETIAPAAQWREALERHPQWLAARRFTATSLAREKRMIAGEESRHRDGRRDGEVRACGVEPDRRAGTGPWRVCTVTWRTRRWMRCTATPTRGVPVDDTALIATIGPAPPDELRAAITGGFGALNA